MLRREFTPLGLAFIVSAFAFASTAGQAQTTAPKRPATGAGTPAARSSKGWVPPRTPWGDPNLQGNFTTKEELNTPFERPEEFAGRRIEDVTPQEMAALNEQRRQTAVENAPFITGSRTAGIAIGVPIHWLDTLDTVNSRPWFVIDPPDGRIPPLTVQAQQRAAAAAAARQGRTVGDSFIDRSLADRCISRGVPQMTQANYGASYQILQSKDYVSIRYEMIHEARLIPIDGRAAARPHVSQTIRSYFGDAVARWDGNTLVVDTTNFSDKQNYRGAGENLHMIERFIRTAPNKVEYTVTLEDSTTWPRPWTYSVPLTEDDGQPIFEYACHEGNYGIRNILAGGREDQKRGIVPSNGPALPPELEE